MQLVERDNAQKEFISQFLQKYTIESVLGSVSVLLVLYSSTTYNVCVV